ncbi:MAG: hypothetical protein U9P38_02465 [Campylobacterota bacterium]|nr:hypothetical protein [Campylobacterota bacterium]
MKLTLFGMALLAALFYGCSTTSTQENPQEEPVSQENNSSFPQNIKPISIDFKSKLASHNPAAYVTSQCYTKTTDENNISHNPCFSCHINSQEPNYIDDADLQTLYDMREHTVLNRFTNLFKDRTEYVQAIQDKDILEYVRTDNYKDKSNRLSLAQKLKTLPSEWDVNEDGIWNGYMPDCSFSFDDEGFDKDENGLYSGWRAFAYYPFLGTFWPTNGSFDDVLIRLPLAFRQNAHSEFSLEVYKINLAIVESLIKEKDISIDEVDENIYGVDLNADGILNLSNLVKFVWLKPSYNSATKKITDFSMTYVGKAKELLQTNEYLIAPGLYPKGTEFLHSVRYIDVVNDEVTMAPRMKELRYAKKDSWNNYSQMQNASMAEIMEKDLFPDRLRNIQGDSEQGLQTGLGWTYQGFIEDENGELRPQNYEETLYCIGCHSGIGSIADSTFVFQRKFDHTSKQNGWYHWSQDAKGLKNIGEPLTKNGEYEYSRYLRENGAGDEFRDNEEIFEKYFDNGVLKQEKIDELHTDISKLLIPSTSRALTLNKAYKIIVDEQSFIYGRDTHVKPVKNVYEEVTPNSLTGNHEIYN